jgi:two-component system probable response regulator PhcQ
MESFQDHRRYAILYVDDETQSLKLFERAFGDQFRIFTASNAQDGLKLLEEHKDEIGLLMTDQRMPGEKGVWLLERTRQLRPRIVRLLATAYSDMDAAIAAVNTGAIYKYVSKPWNPAELEMTLKRGLEFFIVQQERDQLLREKMSVLRNMMIADRIVSLGLLAAGLSHHIRNSLVAVKTFLDLAPAKLQEEKLNMDQLRNPDFWKEYHSNVQVQIDRISNMLRDLWAATETPVNEFPHTVQLREVIAETVVKLGDHFAAKNITVENNLSASLPAMQVDRPKIERLFELLFKDEIVSLPAGSRITLTAEHVNGSPDRSEIHLSIADNGPGLPKEALRLVFDPFMLRSDTPMEYGINLMACYFIVHHHGGKIEAASEPGRGTTFTLKLPTNPAAQLPKTAEESDFVQKIIHNNSLWEKLISSE